MTYTLSLIDKAAEMCGNISRLSKETGFNEGNLRTARAGKRKLPLEWVPILAELAGEDAREAVARVLAEQLPENSRAKEILGKVLAAGVAAMLRTTNDLGNGTEKIGSPLDSKGLTTVQIVLSRMAAIMTGFGLHRAPQMATA